MIPDNYELNEQISNTSAAQVWHARDPAGERIVLKLAAAEERVERRFKREIDAMRAAAGPFTMPVLAFDESYSWYSMPVAAHTLWQTTTPTHIDQVLEVLEAATAALERTHAVGQVHRDLKPQNILRLSDGGIDRWVVADFGIVRNAPGVTSQQLTRVDGLTGSEGWAAPEQYRDAHIATVAADVYAMGGVASWMLTGDRPTFGSVALPGAPRLRAAIKRATHSNPSARFRTLTELLDAVRASSVTIAVTFESLVEDQKWREASAFVSGHPSQLIQFVMDMPRLTSEQVRRWHTADPAGLAAAVIEVTDEIAADYSDLAFGDIDRFLIWSTSVIGESLRSRSFDVAEEVAASTFGATARIGQYRPALEALDWMNKLDSRAQRAIETALHTSGAFGYFSGQASGRWQSRADNDLVRRLREGDE